MEPQVEIYCKKETKKKDCSCLWLIFAVVVFALTFFIGALVTALTDFVAILGVGAVISLIITLGILAVISLIALICCKKSDKILVMNKGELVEVGNHEELMQLKREYYRLWSTQAQYYI